eukprot:scaffold9935_cov122-Isochrysis_galbana.AAC.3
MSNFHSVNPVPSVGHGSARRGVSPSCGSMIVPWGAVGPTTAVGVYKPPHAPETERGILYGKAPTRYSTSSIMMMWFLSPRPCAFVPSLPCYLLCL